MPTRTLRRNPVIERFREELGMTAEFPQYVVVEFQFAIAAVMRLSEMEIPTRWQYRAGLSRSYGSVVAEFSMAEDLLDLVEQDRVEEEQFVYAMEILARLGRIYAANGDTVD